MSFKWGDLLEIAKRLEDLSEREPDLSEAACRAAVSRTYYAMYHTCVEAHIRIWKTPPPPRDRHSKHACLRISFEHKAPNLSTVERGDAAKKVAENLLRLHELRVDADYCHPHQKSAPSRAVKLASRYAVRIAEAVAIVDANQQRSSGG